MTDNNEAPLGRNEVFTFAKGEHIGYPAPGGKGVHEYVDENGCTWQIYYEPERFLVYRRWEPLSALEGEFSVVNNDSEVQNGLVE